MASKKKKPTIGYVMGFMGISGGNRIIYEHANRLSERGFEIYLLHLNDGKDRDWYEINSKIKILPYQDSDKWIDKIDIIVATFNETFWDIIDLPDRIKKAYFIQTDERRFYEKNSLGYYLSNATYTFKNVFYYTEARWMQEWLKNEFGISAPIFQNRINKAQFYPDQDKKLKSNKKIVLVEGNAVTSKKGVQDAAAALEGIVCEKWLLTNTPEDELPEYTKIFDKIFSQPEQSRIRQIYSSADILVKPSYFEGSPLPHIEAMCCGTAVITTDCTGVDEYCKHMENSYIVEVGNVGQMKEAIQTLLNDEKLRNKLIENGLKFAKDRLYDWNSVINEEMNFFSMIMGKSILTSYTLKSFTKQLLINSYYIHNLNLDGRINSLESKSSFLSKLAKKMLSPYRLIMKLRKN